MAIGRWGALVGAAAFSVLLLPACAAPDPTPTPAEATGERAATPTPAEPTGTPTPAPPTFEEEWEALKAAARAEGRMTLVTGNGSSRGLVPPTRDAFGKQFGIEVVIQGGSGSEHMARISAERAAGRYELDIVIHGRTTLGEQAN